MTNEYKYVWLNINTGEFSNSWDEKTHEFLSTTDMTDATSNGWKCIKYLCVNDEKFSFYNIMKIKTNR